MLGRLTRAAQAVTSFRTRQGQLTRRRASRTLNPVPLFRPLRPFFRIWPNLRVVLDPSASVLVDDRRFSQLGQCDPTDNNASQLRGIGFRRSSCTRLQFEGSSLPLKRHARAHAPTGNPPPPVVSVRGAHRRRARRLTLVGQLPRAHTPRHT